MKLGQGSHLNKRKLLTSNFYTSDVIGAIMTSFRGSRSLSCRCHKNWRFCPEIHKLIFQYKIQSILILKTPKNLKINVKVQFTEYQKTMTKSHFFVKNWTKKCCQKFMTSYSDPLVKQKVLLVDYIGAMQRSGARQRSGPF